MYQLRKNRYILMRSHQSYRSSPGRRVAPSLGTLRAVSGGTPSRAPARPIGRAVFAAPRSGAVLPRVLSGTGMKALAPTRSGGQGRAAAARGLPGGKEPRALFVTS